MKLFQRQKREAGRFLSLDCPAKEKLIGFEEPQGEGHERGKHFIVGGDIDGVSAVHTKYLERRYLPTEAETLERLILEHCNKAKCEGGKNCYIKKLGVDRRG